MITVYDSRENNFKHNGLGILNATKCEVEEELNGFYGLELECSVLNKNIKYLVKDNIIKAPTQQGKQLFRIYRAVKTMSSVICYARHIFYDLLDNFIESYRTGQVTGNEAIQGILNNMQYKTNFKGVSNITKISDAFYVRKNSIKVLIGEEKNSFINRWGGEILRDNFNICILDKIGKDNGVTISYGKNLLGLEESEDESEVITRIMATGLTESNQVVFLDEKYIDSPKINNYPHPKVKHIHFGEVQENQEENISIEDVKNKLKAKVQELYKVQHVDIPRFNYVINFIELSKTEEYKNYKVLENVSLGDTVTVKHKKLGIGIKQRIIKYKYDSLLNKFIEIELGQLKDNLEKDFNNISNSIEDVKENIEENNKKFRSIIDKQDDRITLNVEEIDKTKAQIEITANSIISTVEDKENKLNSKIEQTASNISSYVNNEIDNCNSRISQTANEISSKVEKDGVISAINQSSERIEINASKIDLSGVATFSQLENNGLEFNGQTIINGGKLIGSEIVSGSVEAQSFHSRGESYFYNNVIVQAKAEINGYLGMQEGQCAGIFNMNNGYCYNHLHIGSADVSGDLEVKGTKNRVVNTEHYGKLKLNAVESTECWFEDIGRGKLKDGKCIIRLDKKFLETVNTDINYEVQTWAYGNGNVWVDTSKMYKQYVVIQGNSDIEFGYKIIAKQKQYENVRLEESTKKVR